MLRLGQHEIGLCPVFQCAPESIAAAQNAFYEALNLSQTVRRRNKGRLGWVLGSINQDLSGSTWSIILSSMKTSDLAFAFSESKSSDSLDWRCWCLP